jgi:2-dehydro-3-deoxyphosphooctonate aldolase (KDO 8-P synthase)
MEYLQQLFGNAYNPNSFYLLAGPCVVENENITMQTAETLIAICTELQIPLVFKSSFQKANRTSITSFTGIGHTEALSILYKVKQTFGVPIGCRVCRRFANTSIFMQANRFVSSSC